MEPIIPYTVPRGAVHDVAKLGGFDPDNHAILCVSQSTLYLLQNLVALDIEFSKRYAVELTDIGYRPVGQETPEWEIYRDAVERAQIEVVDMSCDLVDALNNISQAIKQLQINQAQSNLVCCSYEFDPASYYEQSPESGAPTNKCDLSYAYVQAWAKGCKEFYAQWSAGGFPAIGVLAAILDDLDLPGTTLLEMVTLGATEALPILQAAWNLAIDNQIYALTCILFQASNAQDAKDQMLAHIAAIEGIGTTAQEFMSLPITYNGLNKVFLGTFPDTHPGEFDCDACGELCGPDYWEYGYGDLTPDGNIRAWIAQRNPDSSNDWYIAPHYGQNVSVEVISVGNYAPVAGVDDWRVWEWQAGCLLIQIDQEDPLTDAEGNTYVGSHVVAVSWREETNPLIVTVRVTA